MNGEPTISVVIPTCNRPQDVERCLESLTSVSYPDWDILLVDQSDGGETREVAAGFTSRLPQFTYQHMSEKGLSRARNLGMRTVRGELIAFLDDDCTVPSDWLHHVADAFARHPDAALIFGTVDAIEYDSQQGHIAQFHPREERVLRGRLAFRKLSYPMGASMYLRRSLTQTVPPMDIYLGAGAYFKNAEDRDYMYQVLASGHGIVLTPTVVILHHGFRRYDTGEMSHISRGGAFGRGAMEAKFVRCGDMVALLLVTIQILEHARTIAPRQIVLRRGPTHISRLAMYLYGLIASFQVPVVRRYRLFGRVADYDPLNLPRFDAEVSPDIRVPA